MMPSAAKILSTMTYTFESTLMPNIQGDFQKSLGLTMINLFRYTQELVEHEGQLQYEDNQQLEALLPKIQKYVLQNLHHKDIKPLQKIFDTIINKPDGYISTTVLNTLSIVLKTQLDAALKVLVTLPTEMRGAEYQTIRQDIRQYLVDNLNREDQLITASFTSKRR